MKFDKKKPKHWLLLLQQGAYTLLAIFTRPFIGKPEKPVVILYGHQFSGNLKALYQEWQRTYTDEFDCYFLSLDNQCCLGLRKEGVNVLQCGSLQDMLLVGRCSVIITDHGLHAMSPLISLTNIIFVDVWHGIPFKGFVADDFKVQHRYDEVWVSSPLIKEIYQSKFGFRADIVHSLGYARTDKLFLGQSPDPLLRKKADIPVDNRIVLYAPTWRQDDNGRDLFPFGESQDSFIQRLSEVCQTHKATLVIRSHLNTSINTRFFDNVRYCSMKDFPDAEGLLMQTDILICDWSSISFDFLATDRPAIFLDVEPPFKNGFTLGKEYRFGKVVVNVNNLCDTLEKMLTSAEWYKKSQHTFHRTVTSAVYGDNTDGKAASRQVSRLVNFLLK